MKIVFQKVKSAVYLNEGKVFSSINEGIVLFVGFTKFDTSETLEWCAKKILSLKLYENWTESVKDKNFEILMLSQYTILAKFDGTKPNFNNMMDKKKANITFDNFYKLLKEKYNDINVKRGMFGAKSEVKIINDGPFTAMIEK